MFITRILAIRIGNLFSRGRAVEESIEFGVDPAFGMILLTETIRQMKQGETSAVTELYDKTSPLIFGLLLRILGDRAAAEECLLEVYTQAWRLAPEYDFECEGPLDWLIRIARTLAIVRRREAAPGLDLEEPVQLSEARQSRILDPEATTVAAGRQKIARAALDSLPHDQRQVIELAYFSGLTHGEIADATSQPLAAVKTRLRLGMIKLSDFFRPPVNEGDE